MAQISVSNLTFCYDGSYDNIFDDVSFSIDSNWKLGFTGRNGKGKTTFLKLLNGDYKYTGNINSPMDFDYFPFIINDETQITIDIVNDINPDYEYWMLLKELSKLQISEDNLYMP